MNNECNSINYISTLLPNATSIELVESALYQDMLAVALELYKPIDVDTFYDEHPEYKMWQYTYDYNYAITKNDKIIAIFLPDHNRIVSADEQEVILLLKTINSYEVLEYDVVMTDEDTDIFDAIENE